MTEKNRIRGKKSRASGQRFELKVREDLEKKGWIVAKWTNNVELIKAEDVVIKSEVKNLRDWKGRILEGKLVKVKNKFLGPGKPMMLGAGFPDFIAYKIRADLTVGMSPYEVIGVEAKSDGYLDKIEKEKCQWLLENNVFSQILIASKGKKRGEIVYKEVKLNENNN